MDKEIIERLEWYDGGDNVTYEYWIDPETGKTYLVDIEIVRDLDNAVEAEWSKSRNYNTWKNHQSRSNRLSIQKTPLGTTPSGVNGWYSVTRMNGKTV